MVYMSPLGLFNGFYVYSLFYSLSIPHFDCVYPQNYKIINDNKIFVSSMSVVDFPFNVLQL